MILEIPKLVSQLVPGALSPERISVACVRTTRPKYLVFGDDPSKPVCVVQFGPRAELERVQGVLQRLHAALPDSVARPLVCRPWRGSDYVQIQTGLSGLPWFCLQRHFRGRSAWIRLRARAIAVLAELQASIQAAPEWKVRLNPAQELRRQSALCNAQGLLSTCLQDSICKSAEPLESLAGRACNWQHGDFCFNNLLVSASRIAVIDFEEFGGTSMPLHDEIGLAISVNAMARKANVAVSLAEDLRACIKLSDHDIEPSHLPGLFYHHVLWRINQSQDWPTRTQARNALVALAEEVARSPGDHLSLCPTAL